MPPIANSTVMLLAASVGAPNQLAQLRIDTDGRFSMNVPDTGGALPYRRARQL